MEEKPAVAPGEVLIVLGHRDPGGGDPDLLGGHGRHRVRHAEELARMGNYRAVILSGTGAPGADSEAQQMARLWTDTTTPLILEEQSRTTAENAAYCLPIILKMHGVRRVTVVSCNWHLRTRYFFSQYRRHGIEVCYETVGDTAGAVASQLARELRSCRTMRRERRTAYAEVRVKDVQ